MMEKRGASDPLALLEEESLSVLVLRDGTELYRSYDEGVKPLMEIVDWFPGGIEGATVADRVVGVCAARVFEHLRAERVLALVGSVAAERVLHRAAIAYGFRCVVTQIRNRAGTDLCPFERLSGDCADTAELLSAVRRRLAKPGRPGSPA